MWYHKDMFTILKPECCIGRSPSHHGEEKYQFYDCHKFNLISFLPHFLFVVCFRVEQERRSLIIPSGSSRRIKVDVFCRVRRMCGREKVAKTLQEMSSRWFDKFSVIWKILRQLCNEAKKDLQSCKMRKQGQAYRSTSVGFKVPHNNCKYKLYNHRNPKI